MRHHPEYVSPRIADSGDVVQGSVGIGFDRNLPGGGTVAKHNLAVAAQIGQGRFITEVVAFHMADRNGEHFAWTTSTGKWSFGVLPSPLDWLADVLQADIA